MMRTPKAQGIAGISAICLALFLSLSITLLAVSAPTQASGPGTRLTLSSNQPTPTPTDTATPTPSPTATPSPTPTPNGPVLDPQAAAAIAKMSAALSSDTNCHTNPNGATLPAGQTFYVTTCFNTRATAGGGTASLSIFSQGAAHASASQSASIKDGNSYYWFQFNPLASGSYTIEVFWNGKLGRTYLLQLN